MISLQNFRKAYEYEALGFAERMSGLIWRDMYKLHTKKDVRPNAFLSAIKDIEEVAATGTKTATPFQRAPLIGLWHKHYFTAAYVPKNLTKRKPLNDLVGAVTGVGGATPTIATIAMTIHRSVVEMDENGKLTGEWMVFLPRAGTNYYLCCGKHNDDEQKLLDRIIKECTRDFPSLPAWIQEAPGAPAGRKAPGAG